MKNFSIKFILGILCMIPFNAALSQGSTGSVDLETVKTVAKNYCLKTEKKYAKASANDITLTLVDSRKSGSGVLYYIFDIDYQGNNGNGDGYIIMSAANDQPPVLGYVPQGSYDAAKAALNTPFTDWLNAFADQIESSIKSKAENTENEQLWSTYLAKGKMDSEEMLLNLTSKWNQTAYFNANSPIADGSNGHPASGSTYGNRCPTGCVATAMGQVMYYYQWPDNLTGSHSYTEAANPNTNSSCGSSDPSYGTLSFTTDHTINWGGMVDQPSSVNLDISKLLYNCAVSVDMDFAYCQSWTNTWQAAPAYSTYFGYNSSATFLSRADYPSTWESIIINQIRNERPVHYRGTGGAGGHSFVCMGYKTVAGTNQFWFNWGWGGDSDGYFTLTSMLFPTDQGAIINIAPPVQPNLSFTSASVATNPIRTREINTIDFTILNNGTRGAVSSTAACYLSTDQTLDQNDVLLTTIDVPSLSTNESIDRSANITVDVETGGTYYLLFEADTDHKVHESNETDNVTAVEVQVTVTPAVTGEFVSNTSGNWTTVSTWKYYDGSNWVTPPSYPTSGSGKITIKSGHTVTVTSNISVDQVTVMTGGQVTVSSGYTLTIANGSDDIDFDVNGTLVNSGTITATGKLYFNSGSVYQHARDGGAIPVATWDVSSNCNITGLTSTAPTIPSATQPFGNFTYNCTSQTAESISLGGALNTIAGNFYMVSAGSNYYNDLRLGKGESGDLTVEGDYIQSGGCFIITGESSVTRKMTVEKNLNFQNGYFFISYSSGSATLEVDGNFSSSGTFEFSFYNSTASTLNAKSNVYITGGTFEMSNSGATGTMNVSGNFTHTGGTITESSSGSGMIVFNSSFPQTYTSGGTVSNTINYTVNSGAYLQMGTGANPGTITGAGTFTLQSGATLGITSKDGITPVGTASGNIQTTTGRVYNAGAHYVYNSGADNQITGTGLPNNITGWLVISNTGHTVTLENARIIASTGALNITDGTFAAGTNLTMASTSTINRSSGTMTGTIQGAGVYNVNYTGNSMTTSGELSGSGYNNINIALNSGQTLTPNQDISPDGNLTITSGILDLGSRTCNRSTSGGILTIANGGTLKIGGTNSIPQNYATHSFGTTSTVEYNGGIQTINTEISDGYGNLIASGTGIKTIQPGTAVTVKNDLTTNDLLVVSSAGSDLTTNGSLIVYGNSTGNVTYKRQLHTGDNGDYHYFSSPLVSNTAADAGIVSQVWLWNEINGGWATVSSGLVGLDSGKGYNLSQVSGSAGLITFTGTLATSFTVNATSPYNDAIGPLDSYTTRAYADGSGHSMTSRNSTTKWGGGGWNLLGNPYTSALDVNAFINANYSATPSSNNFDPNYVAVYIYDATVLPNGKYYYIGNSDGWGVTQSAYTSIQAGQGFFVLAMNDHSTFTFNRSMQVHSISTPMLKSTRSTRSDNPWPGIELIVKQGENKDATRLVYNSDMTFGLDPGYDVGQLTSGSPIEVYTTLVQDNGLSFARQALPPTDLDSTAIPVGISCYGGGEVTFSADVVPLQHYKFYLEDNLTGIITNLNTDTYTAQIAPDTYGTGRFYLRTTYTDRRAKKDEADQTKLLNLRVSSSDHKVIIEGEVSSQTVATVYDLSGRIITEKMLTDANYNTIELPSAVRGICIVKIKDGTRSVSTKVVVL
jgi:hypothetical protein